MRFFFSPHPCTTQENNGSGSDLYVIYFHKTIISKKNQVSKVSIFEICYLLSEFLSLSWIMLKKFISGSDPLKKMDPYPTCWKLDLEPLENTTSICLTLTLCIREVFVPRGPLVISHFIGVKI